MKRLKIKDQVFVKELVSPSSGDLKDRGNATKAAMVAYGLNARSAGEMGYRKLKTIDIQTSVVGQLEKAGVSKGFLDESLQKIITSGLYNYQKTRPSDALNAIHIANKLLDRYPAQRILNASLDLNKELESQPEGELVSLMKSVQEQNRQLLDRLEKV